MTNKTQPTTVPVQTHLEGIEHAGKRADGLALDALFRKVTGYSPVMWGPSIIGYGRYHYVYDSGREGDMLATGFAIGKAKISAYIMPGYQDYGAILDRLGKHKMGKSCLYINKLADVDQDVLGELIATGLKDLDKMWTVHPS